MKKLFTSNILLAFIFATLYLARVSAQDLKWYNLTDADIKLLASWNSNPDGTGTSPAGFDTDNTHWVIQTDALLLGELAITGENSKVILTSVGFEIVTLALLPNSNLDALVDVEEGGQLNILTANYPRLGELKIGSTVAFSMGNRIIPYHDYFNLVLVAANPVFEEAANKTVSIRGNLILENNVVFPPARGGVQYIFRFHGDWPQTIQTRGNVFRSWNLQIEKNGGELTIDAGGRVSTDNQMIFNMTGGAVFKDNGATLYAGNSVNMDGDPAGYDLTGTLILAGTEPGIVNGAGAENNFNIRQTTIINNNPVAALNNLVVRVANTGGEFRFRDGTTNQFNIKGNFVVESQAAGRIRFYNNQVNIGGNIIIEEGFQGTIDRMENLVINGQEPQMANLANPISTKILNVENAMDIAKGRIRVENELLVTNSVSTGENGVLAVLPATQISGLDENRFIAGNFGFFTSSATPPALQFPIGSGSLYIPAELSITHLNNNQVLHYLRAETQDLPDLQLPLDISRVDEGFFFYLNLDATASVETATITIPLPYTDKDHNPADLRILKSSGNNWINLGGTIENGTITSETNFTQGGYFALGVNREILVGEPFGLLVTDLNNDEPIYANEPFTLTVIVVDEMGEPVANPDNIEVTIALTSGDGSLQGPVAGSIEEGKTEVTFTGLIYSMHDTDVVITASSTGLQSDATLPFEVLQRFYELIVVVNPPDAGTTTGEGTYPAGEKITLTATAATDFSFSHWSLGDVKLSEDETFEFTMPAKDETVTAHFVSDVIVNLPPVVDNPVGLQKGIENGADIVINLNTVFSDPEGMPLLFYASSNRPGLVAASVEGSILTLQPLRRGDAVITIMAKDVKSDSTTTDFRVLVYPSAHDLLAMPFVFDRWSTDEPEYSYPESMLFLQSDINDPGLTAPLLFPYHVPIDDYNTDDLAQAGFPYNLNSRTRINARGDDGISFINTGRGRDLGGALVALNTTGLAGINLQWLGGTMLANSRVYAIRLQYRTSLDADFADVTNDNGQPVEYLVNADGHSTTLGPVKLPEDASNREYVQLLWRYYHVSGTNGARAQLRLDDIEINWTLNTDSGIAKDAAKIYSFDRQIYVEFMNAANGSLEIFDISGRKLYHEELAGEGRHVISPNLRSGIYIARFSSNRGSTCARILVKQ